MTVADRHGGFWGGISLRFIHSVEGFDSLLLHVIGHSVCDGILPRMSKGTRHGWRSFVSSVRPKRLVDIQPGFDSCPTGFPDSTRGTRGDVRGEYQTCRCHIPQNARGWAAALKKRI